MKRMLVNLILICVLVTVATGTLFAQDGGSATTGAELNVRSGPGLGNPIVAVLPQETVVVTDGRNGAGDWILIHTQDGSVGGWVAAAYLRGLNAAALPVVAGDVQTPPETGDVPSGDTARTRVALNVRTGPGLGYERITTLTFNATVIIDQQSGVWSHIHTPDGVITGWVATEYLVIGTPETVGGPGTGVSLSGGVLANSRAIYAHGQSLGNHANAIIRIGDSNSVGMAFLCPFQYGNYDLAGHTYLLDTIAFFSQSGSLCVNDVTTRNGFSSFSMLDPLSADPGLCAAGETPLDCALRRRRPSVAIIYLGLNDMSSLTRTEFSSFLSQVVSQLSNHGTIPVLNTFPISNELAAAGLYDPGFNSIIRQVAAQYQVPLLDLQQMAANFPNQGTGPDGYHLSFEQYDFISLADPAVTTYGRNLRELRTLQMLDAILHNVVNG